MIAAVKAMQPLPPNEVVFDIAPGMTDPDRIGRQSVLQQIVDPKGRRTWVLMALVTVVVLVVGVVASVPALTAIALFLVVFMPTLLFLSARSIASTIRAQPSFGEPGRFVVAPDGIHDYGRDSTMHVGWRHVRDATITAEHFVLTMRAGSRVFVPLAGLDPAHDPSAVLDLVRSSIDAAAPPS